MAGAHDYHDRSIIPGAGVAEIVVFDLFVRAEGPCHFERWFLLRDRRPGQVVEPTEEARHNESQEDGKE